MSYSGNEIAIIGIDINMPESQGVDDFWNNLVNSRECIKDIPEDFTNSDNKKRNYVNRASVCKDYDKFDAAFFGYSNHEARMMDPQQRLFLQSCWNALENSGYAPSKICGNVGVYGSAGYNTYLINSILSSTDFIEKQGYYDILLGNDKDYLSTRVSYKLGLTGPSVTVQTACSSSLVGVHLACQSLLMGESDMCLAGGVCVRVPCEQGYTYKPGFILSEDGHCRPFDNDASGTVFGSGVGVVVLKRLEEAINDKDTIYSIIKISAINNDGKRKIGFTAPSQEGQEDVINNALYLENISPESITFIEAHGTGTILGDPIELNAIMNTLGLDSEDKNLKYPCAIGSVKSNIGHMDAAAGIAGLIKASFSLYHKIIVPTINFKNLNNNVSFDNTRFYIADECKKIEDRDLPARALVSAFGVGGTNVSIILEEPPKDLSKKESRQDTYIVKSSAKSPDSLQKMVDDIRNLTIKKDLGSIFYTLNTGREEFDYRTYFIFKKNKDGIFEIVNEFECLNNSDENNTVLDFGEANIEKINDWIDIYNNLDIFRQYMDEWLEYINTNTEFYFKDVYEFNESYKNNMELVNIFPEIVKVVFMQTIKDIVENIEIREYQNNSSYNMYINKHITKEEFISKNKKVKTYSDELHNDKKFFVRDFNLITMYQIIGELWKHRYTINWEMLFFENDKNRVPAPIYHFDKKRYWFDETQSYVWVEKKVPYNFDEEIYQGNYLILSANSEESYLNKILSKISDITISKVSIDNDLINVNLELLGDYLREFINKHNLNEVTQLRVVSLWGIFDNISGYKIFYILLNLLKWLNKELKNCRNISVVLLNQCDSYNENILKNTFITGIMNTLPKELPNISVQQVINYDGLEVILNENVFKQILFNKLNNKIIIHNNKVYTTEYVKKELSENKKVLKENGTYLITGGTGNVGLLFAKEISNRVKANLILISKNYSESDIQNDISEKCSILKNTINEIKNNGSCVTIIKSDVTKYNELCCTINNIISEYKKIDGVIHTAGKVGKARNYIDNLEYSDIEDYVDAKVEGAFNLNKILSDVSIDFCIYTSSTVSILGGVGDSVYSGANAVLNYMALLNQNTKYPSLSVIFDYMPRVFKDEYVSVNDGRVKNLLSAQIKMNEFSTAFDQIFNNIYEKNIVITNTDFNQRYIKNMNKSINDRENKNSESTKILLDKSEIKQKVSSLWYAVLENECDDNRNFFDAGGDSFAAINLIEKLIDIFDIKFTIKYIYEFSTISLMTDDIYNKVNNISKKEKTELKGKTNDNDAIAVIGMSGRFPGAGNINELWQNILNKKIDISHFNCDEMYNALNAEADGKLNKYVGARGIIEDIDKFDYEFFGISKLEAELMDPQQRLFLECVWNALEDAGCINIMNKYRVGVFASQGISSYLINVLLKNGKIKQDYNNIAVINNSPDALATRVSYILNLTGISKTVQTFCSSSLVALEEAVANINAGKCDFAVVGGVNIVVPQQTGYIYNESAIYSNTGEVKPFDNSANGTIFSNGVGVVVLAPKSWAKENGLEIYSDILGIGINNDGKQKAGYLSPSIKGQSECIAEAYIKANITPEQVDYIETHGTATNVGDPIEVHALTKAFEQYTDKKQYCALGSIKGNIGHLDRAAGITSFIKGCLVAYNHCIPPVAGFKEINNNIPISETPFYINTEKINLDKSKEMFVGVSALGVGGTNVHVVVKSEQKKKYVLSHRQKYILTLSASCEEALIKYKKNLYQYLLLNKEDIAKVETTLQVYRKHYKFRDVIVTDNMQELLDNLRYSDINLQNSNNKKINTLYININTDDNSLYSVIRELSKETLMKEILQNEIRLITTNNYELSDNIVDDLLHLQKDGIYIVKRVLTKYISDIVNERIIIIFDHFGKKQNNLILDERSISLQICDEKNIVDDARCLTPLDVSDFTDVIATIWKSGIEVDWNKYNYGNQLYNIHIPGSVFKKSRCWIDE
ncbi:MAG: SDR family NAD(P)-dependent oxidoreductase [Acutalibacteraceae bacterium]|nr:SDR family NAD(P)-dependent oxidoreductase [Acutalibacteraceae bacterium]